MKNLLINANIIILLFLFVCCVKSDFSDYTPNHTLECSQINSSWTYVQNCQYLWNIMILHQIDRWVFLIFCPIIILVQLFFLFAFYKYRQNSFQARGHIFFGLVSIQLILNLCFLSHAVYSTIYSYKEPMPAQFPNYCLIVGAMHNSASVLLAVYLLYFLIFTLINLKSSIKEKKIGSRRIVHIFGIVFSIAWSLFLWEQNNLGLNQFGICGATYLQKNNLQIFMPVLGTLASFIYVSMGIYTYSFVKNHMPVTQGLSKRRFFQHKLIAKFVVGEAIILFILVSANLVLYLNCLSSNPKSYLQVFATIVNIFRIFQAFFLIYIMMKNPKINKNIKRLLRQPFQRSLSKQSQQLIQKYNLRYNSQQDDPTIQQKVLDIKVQENQIDLVRVAQIMTIISGVYVAHQEYFSNMTFDPEQKIKPIYFREKLSFQISSQIFKDYNIQTANIPRVGVLRGTITMFAPRIFNRLLKTDGLKFVSQSFNLTKNYKKMFSLAQGKGGKSGEFFFFSYDNKYVLKTISLDQRDFIINNIVEFFQYYQKNPQSLMAKIYGLFMIKGEDIQRKYDLILMKNILGCERSQVIRTYDMKGSKYDRQVINSQTKYKYNQLQKLTLKDTDFLKLQGKIKISNAKIVQLKDALRKDTEFLKSLNLIDYSILIVKVNWATPPKNQQFWGQLQRIKSQNFSDQYYHIGLIDYMQKWDLQKKGQNWWKSLIGKKQISAQEPRFYQRRFMQFIDQITVTPYLQLQQPDYINLSPKHSTYEQKADRKISQIHQLRTFYKDNMSQDKRPSNISQLPSLRQISQISIKRVL